MQHLEVVDVWVEQAGLEVNQLAKPDLLRFGVKILVEDTFGVHEYMVFIKAEQRQALVHPGTDPQVRNVEELKCSKVLPELSEASLHQDVHVVLEEVAQELGLVRVRASYSVHEQMRFLDFFLLANDFLLADAPSREELREGIDLVLLCPLRGFHEGLTL